MNTKLTNKQIIKPLNGAAMVFSKLLINANLTNQERMDCVVAGEALLKLMKKLEKETR